MRGALYIYTLQCYSWHTCCFQVNSNNMIALQHNDFFFYLFLILTQSPYTFVEYSEIRLERSLPWEHLSWRTTSFWQKVLYFSVYEPVIKDPLSWETIFLWPLGWSFNTGSTVLHLPILWAAGLHVIWADIPQPCQLGIAHFDLLPVDRHVFANASFLASESREASQMYCASCTCILYLITGKLAQTCKKSVPLLICVWLSNSVLLSTIH